MPVYKTVSVRHRGCAAAVHHMRLSFLLFGEEKRELVLVYSCRKFSEAVLFNDSFNEFDDSELIGDIVVTFD